MTNENTLSDIEKLQAENEAEILKNSNKLKLDFPTMSAIRKKLKSVNLLTPPKELNKYAMFVGMSAENIALHLTPEKMDDMIQAMEIWEEMQWDNGDVILECVELALQDEFKKEFYGNFDKCRRLLFRNILPKLRNSF